MFTTFCHDPHAASTGEPSTGTSTVGTSVKRTSGTSKDNPGVPLERALSSFRSWTIVSRSIVKPTPLKDPCSAERAAQSSLLSMLRRVMCRSWSSTSPAMSAGAVSARSHMMPRLSASPCFTVMAALSVAIRPS